MIIDASLFEPIHPGVTADVSQPTADSLEPTSDGGQLIGATELSDAVANGNFVFAEIIEPVGVIVTADTISYSADNNIWPTSDGGTLEGARDATDAEVIAATIPIEGGGAYYPRPRPHPVIGYGYGILPELEGEAIGAVVVAGRGLGTLPRPSGSAVGAAGVAGRSAGQLLIHAAVAGVTGTRGVGSGAIVKLNATAFGRYDDEEAAVMTLLLAA